jgi:hypothetical protein
MCTWLRRAPRENFSIACRRALNCTRSSSTPPTRSSQASLDVHRAAGRRHGERSRRSLVWHLHGDDFAARADFPVGDESGFDDDFAPADLLHCCADFQGHAQRRRTEVVHFQRSRHEAQWGLAAHLAPLGFIRSCRRCARGVTINERGDQPAVHIPRDRDVIGLGREAADGFVALPIAFNVQPVLVEPPAAVTVAQIVGVIVLKCFLFHSDHAHLVLIAPTMVRTLLMSLGVAWRHADFCPAVTKSAKGTSTARGICWLPGPMMIPIRL